MQSWTKRICGMLTKYINARNPWIGHRSFADLSSYDIRKYTWAPAKNKCAYLRWVAYYRDGFGVWKEDLALAYWKTSVHLFSQILTISVPVLQAQLADWSDTTSDTAPSFSLSFVAKGLETSLFFATFASYLVLLAYPARSPLLQDSAGGLFVYSLPALLWGVDAS